MLERSGAKHRMSGIKHGLVDALDRGIRNLEIRESRIIGRDK